jgi:predicted ATP-binding protein involved in virulence
MRIDKIHLDNFKNFSTLDVSFEKGVNLFVGGNGAGKTSILEAINVAVGCFFGSQEQKMQRVIEFNEIKITNQVPNPKREISASVSSESGLIKNAWSRTIKSNTRANDTKGVKPATDYGEIFFKAFENPDDKTIAPIIAFYSTQRLFKDASLSSRQKYDAANARRNGYLQCLKENSIKGVLNEWLGNAVTRRATLQIKEIEQVDLILENVEKALRATLMLFLDLPKDFSLKIYQDPDFNNEVYINYDNEHNLPVSYYSDGFRNLLYLIFDLVWRASQLNPWLTFEEITEKAFGVVTIDEIDLHLHPKWQAKAIDVIQKLFPNVQFFITTHSPTVVANFQGGTLYVLSDNQILRHPPDFFGKNINNVLRNVLGASDRHIPTQNKLNTLFMLIEENKPDEYEPLLNELTNLLGTDDIEISKAIALIDWNKFENQG